MNEFALHSNRLNIKNEIKKKILEKFKNSMDIEDLIALKVIFFKYI